MPFTRQWAQESKNRIMQIDSYHRVMFIFRLNDGMTIHPERADVRLTLRMRAILPSTITETSVTNKRGMCTNTNIQMV